MRDLRHCGRVKHPADPLRCFPPCTVIKSHPSFCDKNLAFLRRTNGSSSPWMIWKTPQCDLIFSKSNSPSKKLSILLLLFFSDGEETRITPEIFMAVFISRYRKIAGHPSEWPTRYISSLLFWSTCRQISATHSEHIGFSGLGIEREHA